MNTDKRSDDNLELLRKAYDPEAFREQGHKLVDQLADQPVWPAPTIRPSQARDTELEVRPYLPN